MINLWSWILVCKVGIYIINCIRISFHLYFFFAKTCSKVPCKKKVTLLKKYNFEISCHLKKKVLSKRRGALQRYLNCLWICYWINILSYIQFNEYLHCNIHKLSHTALSNASFLSYVFIFFSTLTRSFYTDQTICNVVQWRPL